ncbi:protein phosphatase 1 regulatory subunit 14C-like [Centruroides vittatus]|uniref:protein phosphatase 1 regulatory subunit 14C-like n=1 Tax=Centruroides vittatus TaxID=120091 RepID=UPI003510C822
MECTVRAAYPPKPASSASTGMKTLNHGAPKSILHVNFEPEPHEMQERKKKYLTAKYGQHQMSLIKKRLRVEMWMYEQLQSLYGCTDDSDNYDVEIDLDELLDIEADGAKKQWLLNKLVNAKDSRAAVERFVGELLQRAKTL